MRRRLLSLAAALGFSLAGGCGTVMNLSTPVTPTTNKETGEIEEHSYVFGGVRQSAEAGVGGIVGGTMCLGMAPLVTAMPAFCPDPALVPFAGAGGLMMVGSGGLLLATGTLGLIDAPFSLAGDILTLPFAWLREQEAHRLADKARAAKAAEPKIITKEAEPTKEETPAVPAAAPAAGKETKQVSAAPKAEGGGGGW
jgi:uncharacterized protein YceK